MTRIAHAALPADWDQARAEGAYRVSSRGRSLEQEGFIHASTADQLPGVLAGFYADVDEVVLLVLDVEALAAAGSPVRWDDVPGMPAPYPHVYGPIPAAEVGPGLPVAATHPLARPAGRPWLLPDLAAWLQI